VGSGLARLRRRSGSDDCLVRGGRSAAAASRAVILSASNGRIRGQTASNGQVVDPSDGAIGPEVIEACRRGDREALRALYDAYKDTVYSIGFYFFHGDAAAAHDVTQEVFLKLIGGIGKFRGDSSFGTWLYRLVVNACLDRARRAKTRMVSDPDVLDGLLDPVASHEETFARAEAAQSVQAAIVGLPPKLRIAILLRYFDELSYADMAQALNCSIGTVASRLSRGHRLLAKKLAPLRASLLPKEF
jgi:RNA polymerase sigma-70 factor (ECF subfamily)